MRITAGKHRSRVLQTLEGERTRPTADRVKEAVFSSVGPYFYGGCMLDLFGGCGGVALDALSRGMLRVYIADKSRDAIQIIRENVSMLKEEKACEILHGDYSDVLCQVKKIKFDLIYLDPPYALDVIDEILTFIDEHDMLEKRGIILVEGDAKVEYPFVYKHFSRIREKRYGISKVSFYRGESL